MSPHRNGIINVTRPYDCKPLCYIPKLKSFLVFPWLLHSVVRIFSCSTWTRRRNSSKDISSLLYIYIENAPYSLVYIYIYKTLFSKNSYFLVQVSYRLSIWAIFWPPDWDSMLNNNYFFFRVSEKIFYITTVDTWNDQFYFIKWKFRKTL